MRRCPWHADDSESSPEALSGSSPKRILDFTGQTAQASAPEQAQGSTQESEPLAEDIGSSRNVVEGLKCPVTSSFSHPEHQAPGTVVKALTPGPVDLQHFPVTWIESFGDCVAAVVWYSQNTYSFPAPVADLCQIVSNHHLLVVQVTPQQ